MLPETLPDLLRHGPVLEPGLNVLCDHRADAEIGITLGIYQLEDERVTVPTDGLETALLAIAGRGTLLAPGTELPFARTSWVTEGPTVLHAAAGTELAIAAKGRAEVALVQTPNPARFSLCTFAPAQVRAEQRGQGKLGDTAHRLVRTAFDGENAPAEAKLVLGEVINYPGRWSSYPPHHHRQPELYYYRFDPAQGYGHAECGEQVYKVAQHDLLRITAGRDHAQTSAPGYHMYYLWAIRHLAGDPYQGFEYTQAHRWTFE